MEVVASTQKGVTCTECESEPCPGNMCANVVRKRAAAGNDVRRGMAEPK